MALNPVNGTPFDDSFLLGTEDDDLIQAFEGTDHARGLGGGDTILGGDGNDFLEGNSGSDIIRGGAGDDEITGGGYLSDNSVDWLYGATGNDVIIGSWYLEPAYDHIWGGHGDDLIKIVYQQYTPMSGEVHGDQGIDRLEVLMSIPFDDLSLPQRPGLTIHISGPNAGASFGAGTMVIDGIESLWIATDGSDDTIGGGGLADDINAGGGANVIDALGGDDRMLIRTGFANIIDGGDGNDTLTLYGYDNLRTVFDASGPAVAEQYGSVITNVENYIVYTGDLADDVRLGAGSDIYFAAGGRDRADGGAGDDKLYGASGDDILAGGDGNDELWGEDSNDILTGGIGNDRLLGGGGDDVLRGGDGDDTLSGDGGNDRMYGGKGNDEIHESYSTVAITTTIEGGTGNDIISLYGHGVGTVNGGYGLDTLQYDHAYASGTPADEAIDLSINRAGLPATIVSRGYSFTSIDVLVAITSNGDDVINGGDYGDHINAGSGLNTINGFGGDDVLAYTSGNTFFGASSTVDGGDGSDLLRVTHQGFQPLVFTVSGTSASDNFGSVISNVERYDVTGSHEADDVTLGDSADRFDGGGGGDTVFGGGGKDYLLGSSGSDILSGGEGNDRLAGGRDSDTLTGGVGADRFVFAFVTTGADRVTDFEAGVDKIMAHGNSIGWYGVVGGPIPIAPGDLAFGTATSANGQFVYDSSGADGILYWDANGILEDGLVAVAILDGAPVISSSDIYIF